MRCSTRSSSESSARLGAWGLCLLCLTTPAHPATEHEWGSLLGLRTGTEETGPDRPVHPSVHFGPVRPSWTEDRIYVSFIFYKTPQSATCRNPAPPPLVYSVYYLILLLFLYLFNRVSLHLPPLVSCIVIFYFPSLITSISHHLCLVLFFFNQQCGKVQCTMRNAGDW